MIMVKTPLRVSFCGGGSDLESFYSKHGGCVISAGLNRHVYLSIHPSFAKEKTILKYSKIEEVYDIRNIEHRIFKQTLLDFGIHGVEIDSQADVPGGTGLGSSSSFTVGLLHLLYAYKGKYVSKQRLAEEACEMEIEKLGEPVGKQDQYAAAYGGLRYYGFEKDGTVNVEQIVLSKNRVREMENNLMMFYTGDVRAASIILKEQGKNVTSGEQEANQLAICEHARQLKEEFLNDNIDALGYHLDECWKLKRSLASGITNPKIDEYYELAMKAGAMGGKLLGAGGGGFLLFYVKPEKQQAVRNALKELKFIRFGFDMQGSQIIYVGDKTIWED